MGKRGSDLCHFIKKGLQKNKYPNLQKISDNPVIFSIYFPRKTTKLDPACEQFLKDWRKLKHKPYKYSMAKQAVETALKKSDFFKKKPSDIGNMLIYQILDNDEILEKKKTKGLKVKQEYQNPSSVESSGYGSGGDCGNSFTSSDEEMDYKIGDVYEYNEQFVTVQNTDDQVNAVPYLFEDVDTSAEPDLVSVNPNDVIDERNIWQHIEENASENHLDFSNRYCLQDAFSDLDLKLSEGTEVGDLNELMNIVLQSLEEEKKPKMETFYLKEVQNTDDGELWIFSPNAFEEMKGFRNEPNVEDESRIAVDSEQMGKISAAICSPLNIGLINGEIHLCLKH